jgi:hypothetical protein
MEFNDLAWRVVNKVTISREMAGESLTTTLNV